MTKYAFLDNKIDCNTIKYSFENSAGKQLTFGDFINLLKNKEKEFLEIFIAVLKDPKHDKFSAYFWECPPVSQETLDKPFEFVVIKSESLNNQSQDCSPYQDHINNNSNGYVLNFLSPGGTNLIIPTPWFSGQEKSVSGQTKWNKDLKTRDYKNISQFTENAPLRQQRELWAKVAEELSKSLEGNSAPQWLSTHGLGVPYLHVRICKTPMYYQWKEYEKFEKDSPSEDYKKIKNLSFDEAKQKFNQKISELLTHGKITQTQFEDYQRQIQTFTTSSQVATLFRNLPGNFRPQDNNGPDNDKGKNNIIWPIAIGIFIIILGFLLILFIRKKKHRSS